MDSFLRRLKLKKGEPRESEARKKLQKELYSLDKVCHVSFDCFLQINVVGAFNTVAQVFHFMDYV
jgi:hypothetical protein